MSLSVRQMLFLIITALCVLGGVVMQMYPVCVFVFLSLCRSPVHEDPITLLIKLIRWIPPRVQTLGTAPGLLSDKANTVDKQQWPSHSPPALQSLSPGLSIFIPSFHIFKEAWFIYTLFISPLGGSLSSAGRPLHHQLSSARCFTMVLSSCLYFSSATTSPIIPLSFLFVLL